MPETQQPPQPVPVHPDLLAYAKQTTDYAEMEREIKELILSGGGVSGEQLIAELEAMVRSK
jgi:hypothetical protein